MDRARSTGGYKRGTGYNWDCHNIINSNHGLEHRLVPLHLERWYFHLFYRHLVCQRVYNYRVFGVVCQTSIICAHISCCQRFPWIQQMFSWIDIFISLMVVEDISTKSPINLTNQTLLAMGSYPYRKQASLEALRWHPITEVSQQWAGAKFWGNLKTLRIFRKGRAVLS